MWVDKMRLEDQVCSLELSQELKELGVKQESLWYWVSFHNNSSTVPYEVLNQLVYVDDVEEFIERSYLEILGKCSAFTVAELGEMLPTYLKYQKWEFSYRIEYDVKNGCGVQEKNEANARAKMLIWLIKNKKIKNV